YRPSNRDVPNMLVPAGVDLLREHPAGRTAWREGRGDHHPPVPIGQVDDVDDLVIGPVEDRARSIALRTSILMHRLVVLWDVDVLTTPITAGPRAVLRQRRDAPHHHEPRRARYAQPQRPARECTARLRDDPQRPVPQRPSWTCAARPRHRLGHRAAPRPGFARTGGMAPPARRLAAALARRRLRAPDGRSTAAARGPGA